ncbi:MAG: hypothetical protein H0W12_08720, partial [Chitinophagaceae bacterium]|nr:hypothetical protein [Chitinophagaceae bacterium]
VQLSEVKPGIEVTALSFSEQFKNINVVDSNNAMEIISKIPTPAPIDEVRIINTEKEKQALKNKQKNKQPLSLSKIFITGVICLAALLILLLSLPFLLYSYYRFKALHSSIVSQKGYYSYVSAMYLLNQFGFRRDNDTPLQFANNKIDDYFQTDFSAFIQVYLKSKYSSQPISSWELKILSLFYRPFEKSVQNKIPWKERVSGFLNFYRTINYFSKPKI